MKTILRRTCGDIHSIIANEMWTQIWSNFDFGTIIGKKIPGLSHMKITAFTRYQFILLIKFNNKNIKISSGTLTLIYGDKNICKNNVADGL